MKCNSSAWASAAIWLVAVYPALAEPTRRAWPRDEPALHPIPGAVGRATPQPELFGLRQAVEGRTRNHLDGVGAHDGDLANVRWRHERRRE